MEFFDKWRERIFSRRNTSSERNSFRLPPNYIDIEIRIKDHHGYCLPTDSPAAREIEAFGGDIRRNPQGEAISIHFYPEENAGSSGAKLSEAAFKTLLETVMEYVPADCMSQCVLLFESELRLDKVDHKDLVANLEAELGKAGLVITSTSGKNLSGIGADKNPRKLPDISYGIPTIDFELQFNEHTQGFFEVERIKGENQYMLLGECMVPHHDVQHTQITEEQVLALPAKILKMREVSFAALRRSFGGPPGRDEGKEHRTP